MRDKAILQLQNSHFGTLACTYPFEKYQGPSAKPKEICWHCDKLALETEMGLVNDA